jgi:multidrug efflux pump
VRHQGKEVIALGVSMAKGGDIIALGKSLKTAGASIEGLPPAWRWCRCRTSPRRWPVGQRIRAVLIEAVVIVLAVSFIAWAFTSGPRGCPAVAPLLHRHAPRPGGGHHHSAGAGGDLPGHDYWGIGLHKISLGSLIIALGLLVDDAIIAVEMMVRKMEEGYDKVRAATFAYEITAMPMLTGTLITAAGFLPIGIAKSVTGEYTFAIFAVTVIALVLSWVVSVYFVPYLGTLLLKAKPPRAPVLNSGRAPHEHV